MTVSRELLWAAYPDGYLAMRGVSTVGGWHCVGDQTHHCDSFGGMWWVKALAAGPGSIDDAWRAGDLLPYLDPENDPATWACAKLDLALEEDPWPGFSLATASSHWYRLDSTAWRLEAYLGDKHVGRIYADIDTDDPATALAMARAQLRVVGI